MSKAADEIAVFLEFAVVAGLNVDPDSVRSTDPPEPDISCRIDGEDRYFELTRVSVQHLADSIGQTLTAIKKGAPIPTGQVASYSSRESVASAIGKKAGKNHETGDSRFDLLVYSDGVLHPPVRIDLVRDTMKVVEVEHSGKWGQIWLYDAAAKHLVWPES
jgi:hypothetical protein